ncbi:hypothetical protein NGB36_06850 [Streptomyces sp. RB6PN25]|uniref:Secreted protein n=1 Tax=Streptomyces humicola TaxID=2953240 RepID=A0ABT1PRM8_9ACTN|nr:hypothetical protein [Streptomyces humicola]MCQ4080321.1 hypothetical protein [Streptomyces humicola]
MRKLQKAVVVAVVLGSVGFVGAGTASADGWGQGVDQADITQSTQCRSHDLNVDVLGAVGALNALAGSLLNGEGNPAAQATKLGSTMGCNNGALNR